MVKGVGPIHVFRSIKRWILFISRMTVEPYSRPSALQPSDGRWTNGVVRNPSVFSIMIRGHRVGRVGAKPLIRWGPTWTDTFRHGRNAPPSGVGEVYMISVPWDPQFQPDCSGISFELHPHLQQHSQPTTSSHTAMPTPDPPSLLELLPTELLERIFLFASPRDILRLSLVRNIIHVVRFCAFSQRRIFERSIALPMHLCGHPLPFNTRSISLRLD